MGSIEIRSQAMVSPSYFIDGDNNPVAAACFGLNFHVLASVKLSIYWAVFFLKG